MPGIVRADTAWMALDALRTTRATAVGAATPFVESVNRIRTGDSDEAALTSAAI